jgi:gamma-glutamylcyclotransferase
MLVYIDRNRTEPEIPKREYVYRMNMGIRDAMAEGMPADYVNDVLRKFIPDKEDESVARFAKQQAVFFEDEELIDRLNLLQARTATPPTQESADCA